MSQKLTEYAYKGKKLNVALVRVQLPNGRIAVREVIEHQNILVVLPVIGRDEIILLKKYEPLLNEWTIESPSTQLELGERPENKALKLIEGILGKPSRIVRVLETYSIIEYSLSKIIFFIATDFKQHLHEELLKNKTLVKLHLDDALSMIISREIMEPKTIIAILYYALLRERGWI